jgi:hypothetical protein
LDWRPVIDAATFGVSRWRSSSAGRPTLAHTVGWVGKALVGVVGCWFLGALADVPLALGFLILVAGVWLVRVSFALVEVLRASGSGAP